MVGVLLRHCSEDCNIPDSKHIIKKGTQLFIPVYGIHTDESENLNNSLNCRIPIKYNFIS